MSKLSEWSSKISSHFTKEKTMSKQVFETKWGFVAYSYDDYMKLKELNKVFWKARIAASRWNRWNRKEPQNRVQKRWIRNDKGQKTGHEVVGPLSEPRICELFSKKHRWYDEYVTDNMIATEYYRSHHPVRNSEVIEAGFTSDQIKDLLIKAKSWESSV